MSFKIQDRDIGESYPPFVIAEVGINHEGDLQKAKAMVDDAARVGAECVKFQCHIIEDEMIPNDVIPANAKESIWDIMKRCALSEDEDRELKDYVDAKGLIYLCTPFSRAAADRLESMGVTAYKIGSGECNNYPLLSHIASFKKPMIMSTGMNDLEAVKQSVSTIETEGAPVALLHCTSIYPTPYDKVRLGALRQLAEAFPNTVIGLSDHTLDNYSCFGAVALGARILERHFTSDMTWPGPDIEISMDPPALRDLIQGSRAIFECMGGEKTILEEEQPTIDFAYACVVTTSEVKAGQVLSRDNIWVKRPGTGEIKSKHYQDVLGKKAVTNIPQDTQLTWNMLDG